MKKTEATKLFKRVFREIETDKENVVLNCVSLADNQYNVIVRRFHFNDDSEEIKTLRRIKKEFKKKLIFRFADPTVPNERYLTTDQRQPNPSIVAVIY